MDVTEQLEEQKAVEGALPEISARQAREDAERLPASPLAGEEVPAQEPWPVPNRAWLRLAYIFEFWIALLVTYTVWSQVGGQGHLDLIAWYIKLICGVSLAWSALRMTRAMVENARAWNRGTVRWFVAVLAISTLMAGVTYWYHLHEVPDEPDTDENTAAAAVGSGKPAPNVARYVVRSDRASC